MTIELLSNTPLWVCAKAIRKCWASEDKSDTDLETLGRIVCGKADKALIARVGNKFKHSSTLEHLVYTFDIDGISRACLQELARHRIASYSVKSTRYTLKELKTATTEEQLLSFLVPVNPVIDEGNIGRLGAIRNVLQDGVSNDEVKYMLPEAYKTSLVMTINARSLQNFLSLRTSKSALWEIRELAKELYNTLPEDHKYLFEHCLSEE